MSNNDEKLTCPSCGSDNVDSAFEDNQIEMPFMIGLRFQAMVNRCLTCGIEGDFQRVNDKHLNKALEHAKRKSVEMIINSLVKEEGLTMAYMERALELPTHTMMRWKNGDFSAAALTLLRIIATYPWTVEVAEARFDKLFATSKLSHEGIEAIQKLARIYKINATAELTSAENNKLIGTFSIEQVSPEKNTPSVAVTTSSDTNAVQVSALNR